LTAAPGRRKYEAVGCPGCQNNLAIRRVVEPRRHVYKTYRIYEKSRERAAREP
jgi:hypothetical protein